MLNIVICDGNFEGQLKITKIINTCVYIEDYPMCIGLIAKKTEDVLMYATVNKKGVYFLDVNFDWQEGGIKLATKIRKLDKYAKIIFLATDDEAMKLIFSSKVEALDFIKKDFSVDMKDEIKSCLNHIYKQFIVEDPEDEEYIRIKIGRNIKVLEIKDILYFETIPRTHRIKITLKNSSLDFCGCIKEIERLSSKFKRVHGAYVVNQDKVVAIDKDTRKIEFETGDFIYGSARLLKNLEF